MRAVVPLVAAAALGVTLSGCAGAPGTTRPGAAVGRQEPESRKQAHTGPQEPESDDLSDLLGELGARPSRAGVRLLRGSLESSVRVYGRDRGKGKKDEALIFRGEAELEAQIHDNLSAYLRPRFLVDALNSDLQRFEPLEGYLTLEGDQWDLRAGQFVENWGVVDTFNPVDILNRRDLGTDILDPERLGELGARLRWRPASVGRLGEPTVGLYVMPVFRPAELPPEEGRWELPAVNEGAAFEPTGSESVFYALRATGTLSTGPANADVQLVLARGPEHQPTFLASGTSLIPVYYGATTVGLGFRAVPNAAMLGDALSKITFKAEAVYKRPYSFEDSPLEAPDDYVAAVFGLDRLFPSVLVGGGDLILTAEYAREWGASDPSAFLRPFRDDLVARVLWRANDFARTSCEIRWLYDLESTESVWEVAVERQLLFIHENLKFRTQLQLFESDDSLFPAETNNSSLAIFLTWEF